MEEETAPTDSSSSATPEKEDDDCVYEEEDDYVYESDTSDGEHTTSRQAVSYGSAVGLFNVDAVACPICFTSAEAGTAIHLPGCGHSFCIECFRCHIDSQMNQGKADKIGCPEVLLDTESSTSFHICNTIVEEDTLNQLLDKDAKAKLDTFRTNAFVLSNPDYHNCPTADCSNVVYSKVTTSDATTTASAAPLPIIDCFRCKRVSCRLCGTSPFHFEQSCQQAAEAKRLAAERKRHAVDAAMDRLRKRVMHRPEPDRSRANEELHYNFEISGGAQVAETPPDVTIKQCRRCGNGIVFSGGCYKMKCRCGYRFCWECGSENAQCFCTPSHHGFTDNRTGRGDYAGLQDSKSYT